MSAAGRAGRTVSTVSRSSSPARVTTSMPSIVVDMTESLPEFPVGWLSVHFSLNQQI